MNFSININAIIPAVTILQTLIFVPILWLRGVREERKSDKWLAFLLVTLALTVLPFTLGWLGITYLWEELPMLPWDGFSLLTPAAIYFFLCSLIQADFKLQKRNYWAFLPYIVYFCYHLAVGLQQKDWVLQFWHGVDNYINPCFNLVELGLNIYFLYQSFHLYNQYQKQVPEQYSDVETASFKWFRNFLYVFTAVVIINFAYTISDFFMDYGYNQMWWLYLVISAYTYYLSVAGYAQPRVRPLARVHSLSEAAAAFAPATSPNKPVDLPIETTEITLKNTLSEAELLQWKSRLEQLMQAQQPYLEPELTLSDLATRLKTNVSVVSMVINTAFAKNFNDYINEQRVNAFQQRAKSTDWSHLTLLGIAFDSGFNSKTTFNRAFKKHTGLSPTEWMRG